MLLPSAVTPSAVLEEPRFRQRLSALRDEIASLPPVEWAVGWLEQIARNRVPLPQEA